MQQFQFQYHSGTFSQRHMMLVDQKTGAIHIPLNTCEVESQGKLELANSVLSEVSFCFVLISVQLV